MKCFITGITGTVVPIFVAALLNKEITPFFSLQFGVAQGSEALIQKYTDCGPSPALHEIRDKIGNLAEKGYYKEILIDHFKPAGFWLTLIASKKVPGHTHTAHDYWSFVEIGDHIKIY